MQLKDVMRTAFAAREFMDEPVSDEVLYRILDHARFAPSGGNRQGWNVIVVRDPVKRLALADLTRPTFKRYLAQVRRGESPWNTIVPSNVTPEEVAAAEPPPGFLERLVMSPVLLIVTVDLRVVASFDSELDRIGVISGASIYPFVWNILLAAHDEGLGGTLTTFVTGEEPKVRALFGMPDYIAVAAMLPIGKPVKRLTRLKRKPVESFTFEDRWDGEAFGDRA
jgi:nitroreductase